MRACVCVLCACVLLHVYIPYFHIDRGCSGQVPIQHLHRAKFPIVIDYKIRKLRDLTPGYAK